MMKYILLIFILVFGVISCSEKIKTEKDKENIQTAVGQESDHLGDDSFSDKGDDTQVELSLARENLKITPYLDGLDTPWEIVFLDDNVQLITQRPGIISKVKDGVIEQKEYFVAPSDEYGEGGLLGLALDPNYTNNGLIYTYYTYYHNTDKVYYNSVIALQENENNVLEIKKVIIDKIPAAKYHNGGRIAFGPDNKLYITTGDARNPESSQDTTSLAGKVLRLNSDGSIPEDNPFVDSPIYTLGHRNPQGIAWDSNNNMYLSTHGPTGDLGQQAQDRIDYLVAGENYGWPKVSGPNTQGFPNPIAFWPEVAVAPSGIAIWHDKLLIATLKGESLIALTLNSADPDHELTDYQRWFEGEYGRIRTAKVGPDGSLYLLTSNNDGRGKFQNKGDRVLKIDIKEE